MNSKDLKPAGMDIYEDNEEENMYRFQTGRHYLYVVVRPNCVLIDDPVDYGFPPFIRKLLPPIIDPSHNYIEIASTGDVTCTQRQFKGVETIWHATSIDVATLPAVQEIKTGVFKVKYGAGFAVAKIASFEYEIPYIEDETRAYREVDGCSLGPRFLGHLTEDGRTMGLLIDYLAGRPPVKEDFEACRMVLGRLHDLGMAHRDINRDNFVISGSRAFLIDFERCGQATEEERIREMGMLFEELIDERGRGAPCPRSEDKSGQYSIGI